MKIHFLAAPLLALAACDSAPTENAVVQDVAANNMIADDVTEVQDDSAGAQPEAPSREPGTGTAVPPPPEPITPSVEPHVTQQERDARARSSEAGENQ